MAIGRRSSVFSNPRTLDEGVWRSLEKNLKLLESLTPGVAIHAHNIACRIIMRLDRKLLSDEGFAREILALEASVSNALKKGYRVKIYYESNYDGADEEWLSRFNAWKIANPCSSLESFSESERNVIDINEIVRKQIGWKTLSEKFEEFLASTDDKYALARVKVRQLLEVDVEKYKRLHHKEFSQCQDDAEKLRWLQAVKDHAKKVLIDYLSWLQPKSMDLAKVVSHKISCVLLEQYLSGFCSYALNQMAEILELSQSSLVHAKRKTRETKSLTSQVSSTPVSDPALVLDDVLDFVDPVPALDLVLATTTSLSSMQGLSSLQMDSDVLSSWMTTMTTVVTDTLLQYYQSIPFNETLIKHSQSLPVLETSSSPLDSPTKSSSPRASQQTSLEALSIFSADQQQASVARVQLTDPTAAVPASSYSNDIANAM